eukprot:8651859-Pyramimonas_sp.AAC.1
MGASVPSNGICSCCDSSEAWARLVGAMVIGPMRNPTSPCCVTVAFTPIPGVDASVLVVGDGGASMLSAG